MRELPLNKYRAAMEILLQGRDQLVETLADDVLDQQENLLEGGFQFHEFLESQGARLHFLGLILGHLEQSAELVEQLTAAARALALGLEIRPPSAPEAIEGPQPPQPQAPPPASPGLRGNPRRDPVLNDRARPGITGPGRGAGIRRIGFVRWRHAPETWFNPLQAIRLRQFILASFDVISSSRFCPLAPSRLNPAAGPGPEPRTHEVGLLPW